MNRTEMITWIKDLIIDYKQNIDNLVQEGVFEDTVYTWPEMLAEYTGVEVAELSGVERLTDEKLKQIVSAYL